MKYEGMKRGFSQLSKAYYGHKQIIDSDYSDEIMIGFYTDEGGTTGEFAVCWSTVGGSVVPRLEVFDDAWSALYHFQDLLLKMAEIDDKNLSPDEFAQMLRELGLKDRTNYTRNDK